MYDHRLQRIFHRYVILPFRSTIHSLVIVVIFVRGTFPRQPYVQTATIQCQYPAYFSLRRVGYHAHVESTRYLPAVRHLADGYLHPVFSRDILPSPLRLRGIVKGGEWEGFPGRED